MTRGIIASAAGMRASQARLDTLSNNLANISTTGYKRDEVAFSELLERGMAVPGGRFERPVGQLGSGPVIAREVTIDDVGPAISTDNPLDVRLDKPRQYLSVQTPNGIRFTRDGSMRLNTNRELVNASGFPFLDVTDRPIQIPTDASPSNITINAIGAVVVNGSEIALLDVREGSVTKAGDNLWSGNPPRAAEPSIATHSLEGSNVNPIQTMVEIIELQRNFEASQRAVRTQDELTEQLIRSLANR